MWRIREMQYREHMGDNDEKIGMNLLAELLTKESQIFGD